MRISSLQIFNVATNSMANANQAINKTQEQLSSGQRVARPSDDPVAATKIMTLTSELAGITQFRKNIDITTNNLVLEESILNSVNNLILRIKELAVQAGNTATLSESEYAGLASEVDGRLDELANLLNSQNANGDYIFGGYKSREEPFSGDANSGFTYKGDEGQQFIKIANNTSLSASDSGKAVFIDIDSAENTVATYASPGNKSNPPVQISVGRVVDQGVYDEFYPEDVIITFNADNNVEPPGKNFTATERSTGRAIIENQAFIPGANIELKGVDFRISGSPVSGVPATQATRFFGADLATSFPVDFTSPANETFEITVAGHSETFTLDGNVANVTDLANMVNSASNGNAAKLAVLGLNVDGIGIEMPKGLNFAITGGSANIDNVMGLSTLAGARSSDGVRATPGDRVFVDSSNKQDILTTLARFSDAMHDFDSSQESRDTLEANVASTLTNLSNAQTNILNITLKLGAKFNTLESTTTLHLDSEFITTQVLSQLRDVDYAEAATRLSAQSLILQAAQSSFVRISQLTLFSLL
ncbi:MAG: flagellar hook-associated protein 3 FlgL [Lentisphaeria bacterium]|jgi:flagellar hook-associated protein 3 FlgL